MRRGLQLPVVIALVITLVAVSGGAGAATTRRVAGPTRYETAVAVSQHAFPAGATEVIVASGEAFPDALAAAPAAAAIGAPVLLVPRCCSVPGPVGAELRRLAPDHIHLLGGTAAVSPETEAALRAVAPVTRIAGVDRYRTAEAISQRFFPEASVVFVADGFAFAEVLAVGAVAGALGAPILLDGPGSDISGEVRRLRPATVYGAGLGQLLGVGLTAIFQQGSAFVPMLATGPTALAADAARLGRALGVLGGSTAYLVTADQFPDALAAGGVAGAVGAPLLLATGACADRALRTAVAELAIDQLVVVGGTAAVPDAVATFAECAGPVPGTAAWIEAATEADLFDRINAERAARGIAPLGHDPDLAALAKEWSQTMGATGSYVHRDLRGVFDDPRFAGRIRSVGENIFLNRFHEDSGWFLHDGWMHSDGHRRNILRESWDIGGVGVHCAPDGVMWATQNFATLSTSDARPSTDTPPLEPIVATRRDGLRCPQP
ncbi:MAG TPA: cell wall-binding repeat-containing protein [Acidimicrobiales bacterium]|nr:cell wall-binding repeat-containing protein [Acidimicrobiales bacterium]